MSIRLALLLLGILDIARVRFPAVVSQLLKPYSYSSLPYEGEREQEQNAGTNVVPKNSRPLEFLAGRSAELSFTVPMRNVGETTLSCR